MKWIKIKSEGIEITNEQQFNGKTYSEILKEVKEEEIASYELLQRLRNPCSVSSKSSFIFISSSFICMN
jgi:hypothetical protein